jgi:chitinase
VILYNLVPLRSPGSIKPVKSNPTVQIVPTAANPITSTCAATSPTSPTKNTSASGSTCPSSSPNPIANPGFEEGTLDHWNCDPNDQMVTSPVYSGQHALKIVPTNNTTGECDQTIQVNPHTSYTLQAYVQGKYIYIGFKGGPIYFTASQNDASYTLLSYTFTTGTDSNITIFVEGWYAQGIGYADDFSLKPAS